MLKLRKMITVSVMAMTVFVMSGLGSLVQAASAQPGDLVKAAGNKTVYYLGSDSKLYNIPNEDTYFSWYKDWSGVITISVTDLNSYGNGIPAGFVTMRPGTRLIKRDVTTDDTMYAVETNGTLRPITAANAIGLYGSSYTNNLTKVSDQNFLSYTVGTQLPTGQYPIGTLLKKTTGADVYYFDGVNYRHVATEAAFNANRFNARFIVKTSMNITAGGTAITGMESNLINAAQNGGNIVTPPTVVTGSGLTLSLNANTPAGMPVPENGARVTMAKVNLTAANDGAISISSILVKRIGLSASTNISKVWAEQNGTIVASKKSMNSNDESTLTFAPALVVPAGTTVTLDLVASLGGTNAGNIGLAIASASAVSATAANISGSFPINGNLMSPTNYSVVDLKISEMNITSSNVKVGDKAVDLGKFQLATTKDVVLTSVMLKNNGIEDLATSFANLYLEQGGNKVTSNVTIDGRYITFTFNSNTEISKDDSNKLFYIKGDVISKENSGANSLSLSLNKSTDIVGYEKATGFGFNVKNGSDSADGVNISVRNIEAGAISISKKSTSPAAATIVKGSDNVMLLANLRADEAITTDGLVVNYTNATAGQFENVRVYLNGALVDSFDPSTTATKEILDSTITLNKGDNEIKVMAKAKSSATSGSISFTLKTDHALGVPTKENIFDNKNPEYTISGNSVSFKEFSGSAAGSVFTVAGATLTVVNNDGYPDTSIIVQGSTDISLGKYSVKANNDTVKITSIALTPTSTSNISASSVSDIKLFVDGVDTGKVANWGTSGATFSSLSIEVAKDSSKNIEIKGSFDSSAVVDTFFKSAMAITAQDSRGSNVPNITPAVSALFTVKDSGNLYVALGGNTPTAGMLAAKAGVEQEIGQFKFTSTNDDATLTEINFVNTTLATAGFVVANVGALGTSTAADSRIASVKLYNGSTLIDSVTPINGAGKFTISDEKAKVAANSSITLTVKVVLNNISNDDTATNKDLHLGLTTLKYKSSNGAEAPMNVYALANNFRIRKTVPNVQLAALPTTVFTPGDNIVSKFTVSADSNGDVALNTLVLDVASSNVTFTALAVGNTVKVNGAYKTIKSIDYNTTNVGALTIVFNTDEVISAGTSKTFEVYANTVFVAGQTSGSVSTKISEDITASAGYTTGVVSGTDTTIPAGTFIWSDGSSLVVPTYSDGFRVNGLPTNSQVMSK